MLYGIIDRTILTIVPLHGVAIIPCRSCADISTRELSRRKRQSPGPYFIFTNYLFGNERSEGLDGLLQPSIRGDQGVFG